MRTFIKDEMTRNPITLSMDVCLGDALELMRSLGLRHLPITSETGLAGVVSENDIYRAYAAGKDTKTIVAEVMSLRPFAVLASTPLCDVTKVMAETKIGSAIIIDQKDNVVGIFTTTDALFILSRLLKEEDSKKFHNMNMGDYLLSRDEQFAAS